MEEKQNSIQTLVNKGTPQFCYKKQKMESYTPFTTCRRRQIQQKKKYESYELEVLAIINTLKKFRVYLLGQHFKIVTDCSAFQKTMQKKELITRIARGALQIEEFDYETEHRAGSRMKHVDALSRYPVIIVCNDTLTSKLKKAHNIQTLKSLLEKQESE
ncbi:transposon Ty3-I Gag-Pol polyprotein [Trichonephila clavipes]|nr:transposon Ty3-I Gag-Pol polyprotein [Trichonephila clavipes]